VPWKKPPRTQQTQSNAEQRGGNLLGEYSVGGDGNTGGEPGKLQAKREREIGAAQEKKAEMACDLHSPRLFAFGERAGDLRETVRRFRGVCGGGPGAG
jgi:hypothetical protein